MGRWEMDIGAMPVGRSGVRFRVWAPGHGRTRVQILPSRGRRRELPLRKGHRGYFSGEADGVREGDRYFFLPDDEGPLPDPASRSQPEGVRGPSQVVDPRSFAWSDAGWRGLPLDEYVVYELHVGTFTREGTFEAVTPRLPDLRDLGVTAVELMPVAQFSGDRNWGYDGVLPFAPQNTYGGPAGLKSLVNACHTAGLAVILDVVYNHLGPEGNCLPRYGPYFTDRYRTPWGAAVNFDGPGSDQVRSYFVDNALYWITEYRFDALRIDAVHGIFDLGPRHILEQLSEAVHRQALGLGRQVWLIAESDLNDVRLTLPRAAGGRGLDAQWNDDFHHSLHVLLTGERSGYYRDFEGVRMLAKAHTEGFVYSGQYSRHRRRRHGSSSRGTPSRRFVVFSQSHDQVGNRAAGDRLSAGLPLDKLKVAAGVVILSPFIPLLFMGEEYGERAPFMYFTSHADRSLAEAVRRGRLEEFESFGWEDDLPDPQDVRTFQRSKIDFGVRRKGDHGLLLSFYRELLRLRRGNPLLAKPSGENMSARCLEGRDVLLVERREGDAAVVCAYNFGARAASFKLAPGGAYRKILDSSSTRWGGPGETAPRRIRGGTERLRLGAASMVVYEKPGAQARAGT